MPGGGGDDDCACRHGQRTAAGARRRVCGTVGQVCVEHHRVDGTLSPGPHRGHVPRGRVKDDHHVVVLDGVTDPERVVRAFGPEDGRGRGPGDRARPISDLRTSAPWQVFLRCPSTPARIAPASGELLAQRRKAAGWTQGATRIAARRRWAATGRAVGARTGAAAAALHSAVRGRAAPRCRGAARRGGAEPPLYRHSGWQPG